MKTTKPEAYKKASDFELREAHRAGDVRAGAERLKRMRTGTTEMDRAKNENELYHEMKSFNESIEKELKEING